MISVIALSFRTRDYDERLQLAQEPISTTHCPIFSIFNVNTTPNDYFYEGKTESRDKL